MSYCLIDRKRLSTVKETGSEIKQDAECPALFKTPKPEKIKYITHPAYNFLGGLVPYSLSLYVQVSVYHKFCHLWSYGIQFLVCTPLFGCIYSLYRRLDLRKFSYS